MHCSLIVISLRSASINSAQLAFYTINGVKFAKTMIPDHTGGTLSSTSICSPQELRCIKNHPVYRLIQNVPYDKSALHDIRLGTAVNGIWHLLSCIPSKSMDANSRYIQVIKEEINHLNIRVTVHHSNTISVVIVLLPPPFPLLQ
ncbi:MAG: hypothetical protein WBZ36_21685 [Candidatus Nitrosopolaris sp.]